MSKQKHPDNDGAQRDGEPARHELLRLHDGAMLQTQSTCCLMAALGAAAAKYPTIKQNGTMSRGHGKEYTYAKIGDLVAASRPVLSKHGLTHVQYLIDLPRGDGSMMVHYIVNRLTHAESGEFIETRTTIPYTNKPQDLGSTLTYFRRYTMQMLLNLAPDEDDDGVAAQQNAQAQQQLQQMQQQLQQARQQVQQANHRIKALTNENRKLHKLTGDHQLANDPPQRGSTTAPNGTTGKVKPLALDRLVASLAALDLSVDQVDWLRTLIGKPCLNDDSANDHQRAHSVRKIAQSPTAIEYYQNAAQGLADIDDADAQADALFKHMLNVIAVNYQRAQKAGPVPAEVVQAFELVAKLNLDAEQVNPNDRSHTFDRLCHTNDLIAEALEGAPV